MNIKILVVTTILIVLSALPGKVLAATRNSRAPGIPWLQVENACGSQEKWYFNGKLSARFAPFVDSFEQFLSGKLKPVRGFSEALALRKFARTSEERAFAEYWISRSLYAAGLPHIAFHGFSAIAASLPALASALVPALIKVKVAENWPDNTYFGYDIQVAALRCLLEIQAKYPSLELPSKVHTKISDYIKLNKDVGIEAAFVVFLNKLNESVESDLKIFNEESQFSFLVQALWAAKQGNHNLTIRWLGLFFENSKSGPERLTRYKDIAHIIAARAHYSNGQFSDSIRHLKQVRKSSNDLTDALSELAWAQLQSEHYGEAVGTALNLQAGGLRHTFAPEGPMVMAMAMNEICQYPQSLAAIRFFKTSYDQSFRWLNNWIQGGGDRSMDIYSLATAFLRDDTAGVPGVPSRIASEWIRSPVFISHQDEINLLFEERSRAASLGISGALEQHRLASEILAFIHALKPKYLAAKRVQKDSLKNSESLPPAIPQEVPQEIPQEIKEELLLLKKKILTYRRMQLAAPVWKLILTNHQKKVPGRQKELLSAIRLDLNARTERMFLQLQEIAENIQLIEVEIYNGASQDIIWQNAHPDYRKVIDNIKENQHEQAQAAPVWNWGHIATSGASGTGEIWEDELGSFKASLFDNCTSKDRYLALATLKKRSKK